MDHHATEQAGPFRASWQLHCVECDGSNVTAVKDLKAPRHHSLFAFTALPITPSFIICLPSLTFGRQSVIIKKVHALRALSHSRCAEYVDNAGEYESFDWRHGLMADLALMPPKCNAECIRALMHFQLGGTAGTQIGAPTGRGIGVPTWTEGSPVPAGTPTDFHLRTWLFHTDAAGEECNAVDLINGEIEHDPFIAIIHTLCTLHQARHCDVRFHHGRRLFSRHRAPCLEQNLSRRIRS